MKNGFRVVGMALLAGALTVGCASGPTEEKAADLLKQAIAEASLAAERIRDAASTGDSVAAATAYDRFAQAFGQVLGPVSLEDPQIAARMANANTALKELLAGGQADGRAVAREAETIRAALADSVATLAQAAAPQQTITVVAVNYRLQPSTIRVKKGTRVTIRLENRGTEPHEFEIDALDFEIGPIKPGQSAEKMFIADKPGRYSYECHVDQHLQKGMKGTLIIEE